MKTYFLMIIVVGLLAACQSLNRAPTPVKLAATDPAETQPEKTGGAERTLPPAEQTVLPTSLPAEPTSSSPTKIETPSPIAQKMILLSQTDLNKRLNIRTGGITIKLVQSVVWPDTSLGCPQPEMAYAQVETKGFIILLEVKPDVFTYHTDEIGTVIFCTKPAGAPDFPVTPSDIQDGKPWVPVD